MGAQGFAFHREKGFWSEFGGFANYLNLEYYPGPLEGDDQVLAPLSQFLKGELGVRSLVERVGEHSSSGALRKYPRLLPAGIHKRGPGIGRFR